MLQVSPLKCNGGSIPVPLQLERYNGKGLFMKPWRKNQDKSCKETTVRPMIIHRLEPTGDIVKHKIMFYCSKECYNRSILRRYPVTSGIWDEDSGELNPELFIQKVMYAQELNGIGVWFRPNNENHMNFLKEEIERMQGSPMHGLGNWPEGALADAMHDEYRNLLTQLLTWLTHEEE